MNIYKTENIRNVVLLGHGGSGKTTLTEAMALTTGIITRQGKVADGNTISDFDKEEIFTKITKKEKKGWAFLFLGANQDAMKEGGKIGIKHTNTVKWEANDIGINTAFMSTSNYVSKYRSAKTSEELSDLDLTREYENILNKEKK